MQDMSKKTRCFGGSAVDDVYGLYHDKEWGIPLHNDQRLFEMLILEGAQAGLNWETILKKRNGYRLAFHDFVIDKVASMTDAELEALLTNPNIIRNRLKIFSARRNAEGVIRIQQEFGSLDSYLWGFIGKNPLTNHWQSAEDIPTSTPESIALSKDLKKRGMSFVGPTIMYAFMQAVGMVNDHIKSCWRYGRP